MSYVADYRPSGLVSQLHDGVPRFGHSNSIALLASTDSDVEDYKDGIVAFCIFLAFFFVAWVAVLLAFKFYFKRERVGCAAGGEVVDIKQLKKVERLNKFERKDRILRNWRVQTACILACLAIVPLSVLMIESGLDPFLDSLKGIQEINDEVDSRAYRAIQIISQLQESNAALDQLKINASFVMKALEMKEFCPNFDPTSILNYNLTVGNNTDYDSSIPSVDLNALLGFDPAAVRGTILSGMETANSFKSYIPQHAADTIYQVTDFTEAVKNGMDSLYSRDWIIRLWVVILDVTVGFLVIAVLLTKQSVDFPAYQSMTQWVLLPVFCAALVATVVGTCVFVSMAIVNADFCAGGNEVQSPIGALQEMIEMNGFNETSLPAKALKYYGSDCLSENPLSFLADIEVAVGESQAAITNLYSNLNSDRLKTLIRACGDDNNIQPTNETIYAVGQHVQKIQGTVKVAMELIDCSNISPVFRRLLYGSPCNQSVIGLTWLWTTLLSMTIMGLVVLTLRAAFYNPVIRGRRGKRREKEFEDYKLYMSKYYDTSNWELHLIPDSLEEKKDEQSCSETDSTSGVITPAGSEEEEDIRSNPALVPTIVSSHDGSVFLNLAMPIEDAKDKSVEDADDDNDSDYDSTYSYDSDDDIRSLSSNSVFSAIFQKRRQKDRDRLHAHDLSQVPSSSSSVMSRFMPRRAPQSVRSSSDQSFMSISEKTNQSMLSTASTSKGRGARSSDDRYATHGQALYLNNGFFQESDSDDEDDDIDVDSLAGVLMTPPELRYRRKGGSDSQHPKSRTHVRDDPDGFEMEPLSPSPSYEENPRLKKESMKRNFEIV